jgi:hypothetical protein
MIPRSKVHLGVRTFPLVALAILSLGVLTNVGCSGRVDDSMSSEEELVGYGYGYGFGYGYGHGYGLHGHGR